MKRILEVKKKIGTLSKNKKNPFFKSQYLDLNDLLEHIEPLLWEENLILLQPIKDNCVYSIILDAETGAEIAVSELHLPPITDPQKLGSAITYFRRYTLKSLLAISEEDDDGNKASQSEPKKKPTLIVNSKEFFNGIQKKASYEKMKEHYFITEEVMSEYLSALNCDATESDLY
jgi:hypothetical protein